MCKKKLFSFCNFPGCIELSHSVLETKVENDRRKKCFDDRDVVCCHNPVCLIDDGPVPLISTQLLRKAAQKRQEPRGDVNGNTDLLVGSIKIAGDCAKQIQGFVKKTELENGKKNKIGRNLKRRTNCTATKPSTSGVKSAVHKAIRYISDSDDENPSQQTVMVFGEEHIYDD